MGKFKRKKLTYICFFFLFMIMISISLNLLWLLNAKSANKRIVEKTPSNSSKFVQESFALAKLYSNENNYSSSLAVYNSIEQSEVNQTIKVAALYNSANIYFKTAIMAIENNDNQLSFPNLELAKSTYRKTLYYSPFHIGARYNLERVLQISPEKNFNEKSDFTNPERGEQAVTTMKLQALGMP